MGWDRDPELSELSSIRSGRTSPSPRYSSYTSYSPSSLPPSSSTSMAYRRNSTIDLPIIRQTSTHELPPSSIRRSSTLDRPRDYSAPSRAGSVVRSTEPENRAMSPSYSRYASTLGDSEDWSFSTLPQCGFQHHSSSMPLIMDCSQILSFISDQQNMLFLCLI